MSAEPWTADQVALLTELWLSGLTSSQVGKRLTPTRSRNAVIGKVHRLGLSMPPERAAALAAARIARETAETEKRKARARAAAARDAAAPNPPKVIAQTPVVVDLSTCKAILDLRPGDCRWIVAGQGADALYCACTMARGSYCEVHAAQSGDGYGRYGSRKRPDDVARYIAGLEAHGTARDGTIQREAA